MPSGSALPPSVVLRDVTLRDGLQDEEPISTDAKVAIFEALVAAGVTDLELTSFVRPDRVPAMADADELVGRTDAPGVTRWGLVLNHRGAVRALGAGLRHLQFVISVSDAHGTRNAGRTAAAALDDLAVIAEEAAAVDAAVEVTLATAFGCPYAGPVAPAAVLALATASVERGARALGVADTIGTAVPTEVRSLVGEVLDAAGVPVGAHLHDTRGLAIANALAAIEAGASRIDGGLGGLGGCPFAPGASGNLALEDLAHALDAMGVRTGVSVGGLLEAGALACASVGRSVESHVGVAGPRFRAVGVPDDT